MTRTRSPVVAALHTVLRVTAARPQIHIDIASDDSGAGDHVGDLFDALGDARSMGNSTIGYEAQSVHPKDVIDLLTAMTDILQTMNQACSEDTW